jgi:hypothetical protein
MLLTKLQVTLIALALGVVAAGAVVTAQSEGEEKKETPRIAPIPQPVQRSVPKGGNFIVDWTPVEPTNEKREYVIDPKRHCIHVAKTSLAPEERQNDGVVRVDLERGKIYTITASGAAYMTAETGVNADPFAGVVVLYPTDEEDCYAVRQAVLAPGKSITFRSPWLIDPISPVTLTAFFLDVAPGDPKRGTYTLSITKAAESTAPKSNTNNNAKELLRARGFEVLAEYQDLTQLLKRSRNSDAQSSDRKSP